MHRSAEVIGMSNFEAIDLNQMLKAIEQLRE